MVITTTIAMIVGATIIAAITGTAGIGSTATGAIAITAVGAIADPVAGKKKIPSAHKPEGIFLCSENQCRASADLSGVAGATAATGLNGATVGLLPAVLPKSGFRLPSMNAPDSILIS